MHPLVGADALSRLGDLGNSQFAGPSQEFFSGADTEGLERAQRGCGILQDHRLGTAVEDLELKLSTGSVETLGEQHDHAAQ